MNVSLSTAANSSALTVSPSDPEQLVVLGEQITIMLPSAQTGGQFSVMEVRSDVDGGVPFLHTHLGAETFVVLEGTFELYGQVDGEKRAYAAPTGTVVHIPSMAPHGYANVGDTPGRMLMIMHGEHQMEAFFHAIGIPVEEAQYPSGAGDPPDAERMTAVMETYGLSFVEAPPF
jgi:quercetin dioxygenase-like cupin family protein